MPLERKHPAADISIVSAGPKPDAIVVLGGGYVPEPGLPVTSHINETTLVRLAEGLRLRHAIPEVPLVLSGGSTSGGPASAHGYREVALALGVPPAELQVLDTPRDTREEAMAVRELLGEGARVVLVTSASHMPRAVRLFTSAGIDTIPAPTGHLVVQPRRDRWDYWVPSASNLRKTERAIYEYLGHVAAHWELGPVRNFVFVSRTIDPEEGQTYGTQEVQRRDQPGHPGPVDQGTGRQVGAGF